MKKNTTRMKEPRYEVDPITGCWNWLLRINEKGYGEARVDGKTRKAHRVIYEKLVGPIPDGMQLDHLCRNRRCVNPEHLEPVSNAVNARRGDMAKLSVSDVQVIKIRLSRGDEIQPIAQDFGVHYATIWCIHKGRSWTAA